MSSLLRGVIDIHLHSAPDVRPRSIDDLTAARAAVAQGMAGVVLKNHHAPTADRATIARLAVPGAPVFGGVVLNEGVGGLNPDAVEACAQAGGRIVWLPTFGAANHLRRQGAPGAAGIPLLDRRGRLSLALQATFEAVAAHGMALATGHASPVEILAAVPEAYARGVRHVVITHPESHIVGLNTEDQCRLASMGALLERVYAQPDDLGNWRPHLAENVAAIREVGVISTIIASDLGQPDNVAWVDGLEAYVRGLYEAGFTDVDVDQMCRVNPGRVVWGQVGATGTTVACSMSADLIPTS
jgi:hypothetical protein